MPEAWGRKATGGEIDCDLLCMMVYADGTLLFCDSA